MTAHVPKLDLATASAEARAAHDAECARHGRITNMKMTLLHSLPAFDAYMQWYTLYDRLVPVFGERAIWIYSHTISAGTECLICSTFFRRLLIDAGIQPDTYEPSAEEALLERLGRCFLTPAHRPDPAMWAELKRRHDKVVLVDLVAFGGLMVATNLFNNIVEVEVDDYLEDYRKPRQAA